MRQWSAQQGLQGGGGGGHLGVRRGRRAGVPGAARCASPGRGSRGFRGLLHVCASVGDVGGHLLPSRGWGLLRSKEAKASEKFSGPGEPGPELGLEKDFQESGRGRGRVGSHSREEIQAGTYTCSRH